MIGYVQKLGDYFMGGKPKQAQPVPASLFYRKDEDMGIKDMPFDLFISEKHSLQFRIGDHPLQDGSTVSDHVQQELQEVTIEGMFTNHSVKKGSSKKESSFKFDKEYGSSEIQQTVTNTALEKFEELKALAKKKEPVRLVCSLDTYPKMVITKLDYDRDEKSGSSIRFTMTLREVVIVKLKSSSGIYPFDPSSMTTDNDKLIAQMKSQGKTSAEIKQVKEMVELENVEVVQ